MTSRIHRPNQCTVDRLTLCLCLLAVGLAVGLGVNLVIAEDAPARSATVRLESVDDSGVWARVKLIEVGTETRVVVAVHGAARGTYVPHIHTGTCAAYDGTPAFPLALVTSDDRSRTTVGASLEQLTSGAYLVDLHPLSDEASAILDSATAVVCGSLTADLTEQGIGGESVTTAPNTGAGPVTGKYAGTILFPVMAAGAIACAAIFLLLIRRPRSVPATRPATIERDHR